MGKREKEHRKKVANRNVRLKQQKSGMQKAFDMLVQQQLEKLKEDELKVQVGDKEINMEIVEDRVIDHAFSFIPNPEESAKINKEFEDETDTVLDVENK
jgi:hypothetical protein